MRRISKIKKTLAHVTKNGAKSQLGGTESRQREQFHKQMRQADDIASDLVQLVSGIGQAQSVTDPITNNNTTFYVPGPDCLTYLTDLHKIILVDIQTIERPVNHILAQWQFVQKDLIPLLLSLPSVSQALEEQSKQTEKLLRYIGN